MGNSYSTWYREPAGVLSQPVRAFERMRDELAGTGSLTGSLGNGLQMSRLVVLAMVILLVSFSAIMRLTDAAGVHAFRLEIGLAFLQLAVLAASYSVAFIRRHFRLGVRLFSYMTAGLIVLLAAANGFDLDYALGLLFIIPALGTGFGLAARASGPPATFFAITCTGAAVACVLTAGPAASSFLFIASLVCISSVTLLVCAGWVDARNRYLASEERYRAVVEQSSDGIVMLDAGTLRILGANQAICDMIGTSRRGMQHLQMDDFLEGLDGGRLEPEALLGRYSRRTECNLRRTDGSTVSGELKVDRIRHVDGDVLSVVVRDITSRKEYEDRLVRAKESAEEIARFKSTLLSNMSHEIRTPLTGILGWTSVLGKEVPERHCELVELIEISAKRLHHTLDSVLELAHLQANVRQLCPVHFDLNDAVHWAADRVRSEADDKGLSLAVSVMEEPVWVEADRDCLRRVLRHVLDNAVKFTEVGSITVSVDRTGGELALVVRDTGVGISRDFMPSIFDEFKQESSGLSRAHEGSGLGLSLVRRLTELIGGRIDVYSEQGVGTTCTVYLPDTIMSGQRRCA